jgi:protein-S-isoprenylcysteine O-methyltransferase Ste14
MNGLFLRALVAFLALPGIVAFAVPLLLFDRTWPPAGIAWGGSVLCVVGVTLLALTVGDFYVVGRGTLAPWAPPQRLVTIGLYRWSRNPMYVAVLMLVGGWALLFRSAPLALYAAGLLVAFHLRVVLGEEPWLARRHGPAWQAYADRVPRWVGRLDRRAGEQEDS